MLYELLSHNIIYVIKAIITQTRMKAYAIHYIVIVKYGTWYQLLCYSNDVNVINAG